MVTVVLIAIEHRNDSWWFSSCYHTSRQNL